MSQKLEIGQERKTPSFILCTCGNYAKKLFYQTKTSKHNGIEAGYCKDCNIIVVRNLEVKKCPTP